MRTTSQFDPEIYGKPERLEGPAEHLAYLTGLRDLAATAQVDVPGLSEAIEAVESRRRIADDLRQRREDPRAAARRIADQLLSGDLDLDRAAAELAAAQQLAPDSPLASAVRLATERAPGAAFAQFAEALDADVILDQARGSAIETREAISKLRSRLDGIASADDAVAAGAKTASAWSTYAVDLIPRWRSCQQLIRRLRDLHLVSPLPLDLRPYAEIGRPDLRDHDVKDARRAGRPVRLLLDPECDAWVPTGPHTEDEARTFAAETREAAAEADQRDAEVADNLRGTGLGRSEPSMDRAVVRG
ncbi:MAG: hypothetical protein WD810_06565 [Solirubrobacterales bacterium]